MEPGTTSTHDRYTGRSTRKGCLAVVDVQGEEDPTVYDPNPA